MKSIIEGLKSKFKSISVKVPFVLIFSFILVFIVVAFIVYSRFERRMLDEFASMAEGAAILVGNRIDGDKVDQYIDENFDMPEYNDIRSFMWEIYDNYPEIYYVYVYKIDKEGGHVIFDLDSGGAADYDLPNEIYKLEEPFASHVDEIMAGEQYPKKPISLHTRDNEYLMSYLRPVFDSNGYYACSVGVDFSMDQMHSDNIMFILKLSAIMIVVLLLILNIDIFFVNKYITTPLKKIAGATSRFSYETDQDRYNNVAIMEELNIRSEDEIEDVYNVFISSLKESLFYMMNLKRARKTIEDNESKIKYMSKNMYKDPLTSVGNKSAYLETVEMLNTMIKAGSPKFSVVMIDINNLKYINDSFGHEKGDLYIKGCCSIACKVFEHSPVYRIGGDEFVVILQDNDFERRQMLYAKIMIEFHNAYMAKNKEPWERFTASVGMSDYVNYDSEYKDTFKRADDNMYQSKLKFKEKYGSYR